MWGFFLVSLYQNTPSHQVFCLLCHVVWKATAEGWWMHLSKTVILLQSLLENVKTETWNCLPLNKFSKPTDTRWATWIVSSYQTSCFLTVIFLEVSVLFFPKSSYHTGTMLFLRQRCLPFDWQSTSMYFTREGEFIQMPASPLTK